MDEHTDHDAEDMLGEPVDRPGLERTVPEVVPTQPPPETQPVQEPSAEVATPDVAEQPLAQPEDSAVENVVVEDAATEDADGQSAVADSDGTEAPTPEPKAENEAEAEGEAQDADEASDAEALPRPETAAAAGIDDTPTAPVAKGRVPWWPFIIYLVAWIALIGASFYLISFEPEAMPAFQQDEYPYILLGGLVLTVLGPLLALTVWFVTWLRTAKDSRGGLLTSALLKGALTTCFGVLAWWGAIAVLDALRLGLIGPIS